MIRRSIILAASLVFAVMLVSCGNDAPAAASGTESDTVSYDDRYGKPDLNERPSGEIDIDLTTMDAALMYGQLYEMAYSPDEYNGKTVKISGPFSYYEDPETKKEYFAVLISDVTACCTQAMEFELDGDYVYPQDYPPLDSQITVVGEFNCYTENYTTYCQLRNAKIVSEY